MECIRSRTMEEEIRSRDELFDIIRSQKLLTIAMSQNDEPYLATLDFGFDESCPCFYFHTFSNGRKVSILRKNPLVFGQVQEDRGFVKDACDHAFRLVQFKGRVRFLTDPEEIENGLTSILTHLGSDPDSIDKEELGRGTLVGRIDILEISGRKNEPRK